MRAKLYTHNMIMGLEMGPRTTEIFSRNKIKNRINSFANIEKNVLNIVANIMFRFN